MSKTAYIRARIQPDRKAKAEKIFNRIGLSASEAISAFYNMVILNKGIPFDLKIPTKETLEAMKESSDTSKLKKYGSTKVMLEDIED